jgi:polysaccharide biosynthesis/export protein
MATESLPSLSFPKFTRRAALASLAVATALLFSGCATVPPAAAPQAAAAASSHEPEVLTLKEGDTLRISFPGVPTMDTTQQVRQDGRINLPMLGEQVVAGKTTDDLTKELLELYASKLVSKEVMVTLVSSSFPVYVTGAVLHPGKILADRPISAFEAIMEAGGFDKARANLTAVVVIRQENGQTKNYTVNLQAVLEGTSGTPFMLKRADTLYVPEKFSWF